jgi:hypothetical protein
MLAVPLQPATEAALRERAEARGQDAAVYAAQLIHDALNAPSVEELLAPFRRQVAESGATDAELDELAEELRNEAWQEGPHTNGAAG